MPFEIIFRWEFREFFVGLGLIPESDGGKVVLEGQITATGLPAESLEGDFEFFFEPDWVHDMPAVKAEPLLGVV